MNKPMIVLDTNILMGDQMQLGQPTQFADKDNL